jgi:hypothetical protein
VGRGLGNANGEKEEAPESCAFAMASDSPWDGSAIELLELAVFVMMLCCYYYYYYYYGFLRMNKYSGTSMIHDYTTETNKHESEQWFSTILPEGTDSQTQAMVGSTKSFFPPLPSTSKSDVGIIVTLSM